MQAKRRVITVRSERIANERTHALDCPCAVCVPVEPHANECDCRDCIESDVADSYGPDGDGDDPPPCG